MPLSIEQQTRAVRFYIKEKLNASPEGREIFKDCDFLTRFDANFVALFGLFADLYGHRDDCLDQLVALVELAGHSWRNRPQGLKALDRQRELNPDWFTSQSMLGGACYVDRYAGNLNGVRAQIPYFKELGLTYLHLLPLFETPEPLSDGGYAISDYRRVKPCLGTIEDLRLLAIELREAGISLVLDMVFNHTSSEHEWARKAEARDPEFEAYYWIFPDRSLPDAFEKTTREIFPDDHPGCFINLRDGRWIWSTFYRFQWDLNYSNPTVFRAMAGEMLHLANIGVEVFRIDAAAFIWKQLGTPCESLPEAHKIIQAFNSLCRIAAPSVIFKSEAIVHPDEVVQYIDRRECQLSYNPLQMTLTWEALAMRDVSMLSQALECRHNISPGCAWVNYVRSHDDIGWTFSDADAAALGIDGAEHRLFLNAFFTNRFAGSFARGVPFQANPRTGDCRVCGTTASLAGLEAPAADPQHAIARILLAYSIAMSTGGLPLIYLGDEVAALNDYAYIAHPARAHDSRWVHRPAYPTECYAARQDGASVAGCVYAGLTRLIRLRKATQEFAGGQAVIFDTHNRRVLGYQRVRGERAVLCLVNFSDVPERVARERFVACPEQATDLVAGNMIHLREKGVLLQAHQYVWLYL